MEKLEARALLSAAIVHSHAGTAHPHSASISGVVFVDFNADLVQTPGESGLAGVKLYIGPAHHGVPKPKDAVAITDANGHYIFTGLASSRVTVHEVLPVGLTLEKSAKQGKRHIHRVAHGVGQNFADVPISAHSSRRVAPTSPSAAPLHFTVSLLPADFSVPPDTSPISPNRQFSVQINLDGTATMTGPGGSVTITPPSGAPPITYIQTVSDTGQVIGILGGGPGFPFLYADGQITNLNLPGSDYTGALGVNSKGQVSVSATFPGSSRVHSYIYSGGSYFELVPPGAVSASNYYGAINDAGDVVGVYTDSAGVNHGFLYANHQFSPVDLGGTYFRGMNESDEIVTMGYTFKGFVPHGYLFADGQLHDLNDLIDSDSGWLIDQAFSINDQGQIIALASPVVDGQLNYAVAENVLLTPG